MNYEGCSYNVTVEWEDGSITHKPINSFTHDTAEIYVEYRETRLT